MPDIDTREAQANAKKTPPAVTRSAQRRTTPASAGEPPEPRLPLGVKYLPRPPRFSMGPDEFFAYWSATDQAYPDRGCAYVYRTWPMIDRQSMDATANKYIDKMGKAFEDPSQWRQEMLHRFGSGNYKIILNDAGGTSKSVGQTLISDLRDADYPPVISNLDELVMDDPSNQSYIENLRQKGLLQGEQAMASGEAMSALTGTIDRLVSKVSEKKEAAPPQPQQTPEAVATKSLEMQQQAFSAGLNLAKEATAAQVAAAESKASNLQGDPKQSLGMLRELLGVIKDLKPDAPASTGSLGELTRMVETFMGREAQLQGKILEILQAQISALQNAKNPETQTGAKDDLVSNLERLAKVKDTIQDLFGGGDRDDERPEKPAPPWMRLAESALSSLPALGTALLGMSYNLALARGKAPGEPIHPGAIPIAEIPAPDAQTATPTPNAAGTTLGPAITAMLRTIEGPFLLHLNDPEKTGADFAEWLSSGYGEIRYQTMREMGKDAILALLLSYPPIAGVITQVPARTDQFLEDFLHAFEGESEDGGSPEAKAVS